MITKSIILLYLSWRDCRDRMIVGYTTTRAISVYHN
jgi:hypothetical protein